MRPRAYVVCAAGDIAPGEARAFSLVREEADGGRPFGIVLARTPAGEFVGYRNLCPHEGVWLNIGEGRLVTPDGARLQCGRHKAAFEIESGLCVSGPCEGESLYPLAIVVIGDDVCLLGEPIAEERDDDEETMEIMIHPD